MLTHYPQIYLTCGCLDGWGGLHSLVDIHCRNLLIELLESLNINVDNILQCMERWDREREREIDLMIDR